MFKSSFLNLHETVRVIKQTLLTLLLSSFTYYISFAQVSGTISTIANTLKGTVIDSTSQSPLIYVSVAIQETRTNQILQTTLSHGNGSFKLNSRTRKQQQLVLSYVGYKTKTIHIPAFTANTLNFGIIVLAPIQTQLEEVQVVTNKPLVEQDIEKTTYNVDLDPESNILNTLDILRKVPFLTVDADDNLQLNGNDNYLILINGKRSSLFSGNPSEVLKSLPASAIKKVEVIRDPSAGYEAAGVGGIINFITYKKSISGYNGSVNFGAKNPSGYQMGGYLTAKLGKFGYSGRLNNSSNNNPANKSSFFREDRLRQSRLGQTGESNSHNNFQSLSHEFSYEPSSWDLITTSFGLNRNKGGNTHIQQVEQRDASGELTEAYQNLNTNQSKGNGNDFNLDYQHSFRKSDQQRLSLSFNFINNANKSASDFALQPLFNYMGRVSTTASDNNAREYTLQADYVQPIGKQMLEIGIKSMFQENSSDYFYKNQKPETGELLLDSSQSNNFNYHQEIHAAYGSLNFRKGSWSLRTGVRLEETRLNAHFRSSGTHATPLYRNLFPNFALSRLLKSSSTIKLSYSQRIERPGLDYLNPYIDQTDPLNISYGNPDLDPATSHVFQLNYNTFVKGISANASVFHDFTSNSIEYFTILGADSVARTTFGNIGRNQNYGFSFSGNTTLFKKLSINLNSRTQYVKFTSIIEGEPQTNEGFTYNMQVSTSYRFGKSWRASGNINYNSPNVLVQGRATGYTSNSLAVNKEFLKNKKASVGLSVRSPFQKTRFTSSHLFSQTFYQRRESYTVIRQFNLSFNYRFSKL